MAEIRVPKLQQSQTKIRIKNVPIAVTPEGFWCCPSPPVFQKSLKPQKSNSNSQTLNPPIHKKTPNMTSSRTSNPPPVIKSNANESASVAETPPPPPQPQPQPKKVAIEFGEAGTSDLRVILLGKQGVTVKLSVHRSVVAEHSRYFAGKILDQQLVFPCIEIDQCDDVEMYVETIGLMYCKEPKQRLMKQSVARVLRILKVGQQLGFATCVQSCLDYLEAAPWVGEEEENKVVSSVLRLQGDIEIKPVLNRVSSDASKPPDNTLSQILELVLRSKDEKARREMKSIVLKLLRENNGGSNLQNETLYASCQTSVNSLVCLYKLAVANSDSVDKHTIALEADNLLWLVDILADRQAADEFAAMWVGQEGLAQLHEKLPVVVRHHVSMVTARVFVGIGRGEILPAKEIRSLLLGRWMRPLMEDYGWLQHACRSFDQNVVEEGIGRTVLTLPLEEQQNVLMGWLGSFLKSGDNCPNLMKAFEVWWRRTFVKPHGETAGQRCIDGEATPQGGGSIGGGI